MVSLLQYDADAGRSDLTYPSIVVKLENVASNCASPALGRELARPWAMFWPTNASTEVTTTRRMSSSLGCTQLAFPGSHTVSPRQQPNFGVCVFKCLCDLRNVLFIGQPNSHFDNRVLNLEVAPVRPDQNVTFDPLCWPDRRGCPV